MSEPYDPPQLPLEILYRDDHLLAVCKPAGLLSVPGKAAELADCLLSRLLQADPATLLVHRLDRDTSGVMIFARSRMAQRHLGLQFERRHASKGYVARVWGEPLADSGTIDLPLAADWPNRPRQMVDLTRGRRALTRWRLLEREGGTARLALMPETGRSHQLRVHMAEIGHPILGDPIYAEGAAGLAARLMLHAERLTLRHPVGGAGIEFVARCPF
ncbi:RluA family pseudouridine synthase [Tropicimonas sp. IMCC34043]|uniref:RluA family pseudouridine synthase n=1 Tax=Tropicimonas sp. IMCC34043 TaxID=2248760 RepID=UPI000E220400|nr:RluA family pseudouridine synthase [Tropicimonas sp. IMCC34043]